MGIAGKEIGHGFYEQDGSSVESLSPMEGEARAEKTYRGPYGNRWRFIEDFILNNKIMRDQYPAYPIYAESISITGERLPTNDGVKGYIEYADAVIACSFKSYPATFFIGDATEEEPEDNETETLFEEDGETKTAYRELVDPFFTWQGGFGADPGGNEKKLVDLTKSVFWADATINHTLAVPKQKNPKWLEIIKTTGQLNNEWVIFPNGMGFAPGHVRFSGAKYKRVIDTSNLGLRAHKLVPDPFAVAYSFECRTKLRWDETMELDRKVFVGENIAGGQRVQITISTKAVVPSPYAMLDFKAMFSGTEYKGILRVRDEKFLQEAGYPANNIQWRTSEVGFGEKAAVGQLSFIKN